MMIRRGARADPRIRDLGHVIREIREKLGLSQRQMAERTGLALHTIYRMENGQMEHLDIRDAYRLARFLGVDLEAILLLLGEEIPEGDAKIAARLARIERKLDSEQREKLRIQLEPILAYWSESPAPSVVTEAIRRHLEQRRESSQ
jgi:transcriptional regulator with XRE-family HTH domain